MMANIKNYDLMHMWLRKKLCYFTMNNEESDPWIVDIVHESKTILISNFRSKNKLTRVAQIGKKNKLK